MSKIPKNRVTWFQLPADDVDRAYNFYNEIFNWNKSDAWNNETHFGAINGSIESRSKTFQHPRLVIRVDDIDQTIAQIKKTGCKIVEGKTEIPEINMVYAAFEDTEGNIVNIVGDLVRSNFADDV